jgi:ankyrin repeat protein
MTGDLARVEEMLQNGVDPTMDNNEAIRIASVRGYTEIVQCLIQYGVNLNEGLQWASQKGQLKVVQILLEAGAHAKFNDSLALKWASLCGHLEIVRLLLEYGVDPTAIGGKDVEDWLIKDAETEEIKELLIQYKYKADGKEYQRLKGQI